MDLERPLQSVFPGPAAMLVEELVAVAGVAPAVSARELERRTGLAHQTVLTHLHRLVDLGVVCHDRHGWAINPDNAVASMLVDLARPRRRVLDTLARTVADAGLNPHVLSVGVFGSFARGNAHADSDVDVLVITDDPGADLEALDVWCQKTERLTGNTVRPVVLDTATIAAPDQTAKRVLDSILADLVVIYGPSPTMLARRAS